jgi:hypothetical protein
MGFEMYLINAYKGDAFYADEIIYFPSNCPFGNLDMKYQFIFTRLNLLNETIKEIHKLHTANYERRKKREGFPKDEYFLPIALGMRFSSELKIITDEMISLNCVVEEYKINKQWSKKIEIDCIGRLIEAKNPLLGYDPFYQNQQLLKDINGIGNAVKHSFINTNILWIRHYESRTTILYALYQKQNDQNNVPEFIKLEMPKLVQDFNKLISEYKIHMKNNYRVIN